MNKKVFSDEIVIYSNEKGNTELRADIDGNTVWANRNQISMLFDTTPQNISLHLVNIYKDNELEKDSTRKESFLVQNENGRRIKRSIDMYNLDAIIAVGYRINSKKATKFRIWATKILHEYIINVQVLNSEALSGTVSTLDGLRETMELIESKKYRGKLKGKLTLKLTRHLEP
jgi:hypothetical protein